MWPESSFSNLWKIHRRSLQYRVAKATGLFFEFVTMKARPVTKLSTLPLLTLREEVRICALFSENDASLPEGMAKT